MVHPNDMFRFISMSRKISEKRFVITKLTKLVILAISLNNLQSVMETNIFVRSS